MAEQGNNREVERDAFFYYLLVANIVLLLIVGVLVIGAVRTEYSGVKYITRPAIGNQSSVFVEITIPANRKSLYLINPYNEIIRHLVRAKPYMAAG